MPEILQPEIYKVIIPEHEDCFGTKIYKSKYFDNEKDAQEFVDTYNQKPTGMYWCLAAEYIGRV